MIHKRLGKYYCSLVCHAQFCVEHFYVRWKWYGRKKWAAPIPYILESQLRLISFVVFTHYGTRNVLIFTRAWYIMIPMQTKQKFIYNKPYTSSSYQINFNSRTNKCSPIQHNHDCVCVCVCVIHIRDISMISMQIDEFHMHISNHPGRIFQSSWSRIDCFSCFLFLLPIFFYIIFVVVVICRWSAVVARLLFENLFCWNFVSRNELQRFFSSIFFLSLFLVILQSSRIQ